MTALINLFFFLVGLIFIVKGGDAFVDAAAWMAEVSGIPKFVVGATVVSLATTLPELFVSAIAAAQGKVDMALGNAIGSVTANTGLIFALSVLCIPAAARRRDFLTKGVLLLVVVLALLLVSLNGELTTAGSLVLLAILVVFVAENLHAGKANAEKESRPTIEKGDLPRNLVSFILGAIAIVLGSQLLVNCGSSLARIAGISEKVISVTAIAIGTSLPELVTTITAIRRRESSLSVGNILGANIIDTALILPVCALVSGGSISVAPAVLTLDLPFCLGIACVAVLPTLFTQRLQRWQGVVCMGLYAVYLGITCL